jgi:hypothetical protein
LENKFKKGDKVVPSKDFGKGYTYGLSHYDLEELKKLKYLTVTKCGKILNGLGATLPAVWFFVSIYYWPPSWFRKMSEQLEFDFNAKV